MLHLKAKLVSFFFFKKFSWLFPSDKIEIIPCDSTFDKIPFLSIYLKEFSISLHKSDQKSLKNSGVNPPDPGIFFLFFVTFYFSSITEFSFGILYPWRTLFKSTPSKQLSFPSYKLISKNFLKNVLLICNYFSLHIANFRYIYIYILSCFFSPQKYLVGFRPHPCSIHEHVF